MAARAPNALPATAFAALGTRGPQRLAPGHTAWTTATRKFQQRRLDVKVTHEFATCCVLFVSAACVSVIAGAKDEVYINRLSMISVAGIVEILSFASVVVTADRSSMGSPEC